MFSLPPLSLSLSLTTFSLCCWLGSVLGSTCPQNEYTFACISALPWLACYPLCRRVWLMIRVCHFSQQLSRPPARAHIKHPNAGKKRKKTEFHFLQQKWKAYACLRSQLLALCDVVVIWKTNKWLNEHCLGLSYFKRGHVTFLSPWAHSTAYFTFKMQRWRLYVKWGTWKFGLFFTIHSNCPWMCPGDTAYYN